MVEATSADRPAGIIYPPPEIRQVVDKTANYVAKNGGQFEERIREDRKHDQKFSFLNPNDPYRAYYDMKVKEAKEGNVEAKKEDVEKTKEKETALPKPDAKPIMKEPPPYDFIAEMPNISAQDLSLVSQYVKVLAPPKPMMSKLQTTMENKYSGVDTQRKVLDRISSRVEYEQFVADEKKKAEAEADQEKLAYAMIDWHDFVVVETVEFVDADEVLQLPPPISIMDLEGLSLAQKRSKSLFNTAPISSQDGEDDGDMDIEGEIDSAATRNITQPLPPRPQLPPQPRPPSSLGAPLPRPPMPQLPNGPMFRPPPRLPTFPQPGSKPTAARAYEGDGEDSDAKRQKIP
ncbi:hypothetical protein HDU67_002928 [Dinochytrium kinnereticum]|nr:hypothetical protein HDU67_002928 [Dinochytrium kinnereticum]